MGARGSRRGSNVWPRETSELGARSARGDAVNHPRFDHLCVSAGDTEGHAATRRKLVFDSPVVGPWVLRRRQSHCCFGTELDTPIPAAVADLDLCDARHLLL